MVTLERLGMLAAECKGFYDMHGEAALKNGMSDRSGGTKGGTYSFAPSQCDDVFRGFFGTDNPFAALEGAQCAKLSPHQVELLAAQSATLCSALTSGYSRHTGALDSMASHVGRVIIRKTQLCAADLATSFQALGANDKPKAGKKQVHALLLTLEEINTGCLKKVRRSFNAHAGTAHAAGPQHIFECACVRTT